MPRVPPNFRRSDLQRAIVGAREEGLDIERIEVRKDGGFVIYTGGKLEITDQEAAARQAWQRATEEPTAKPPPGARKPSLRDTAKSKTSSS